MELFVLAAAILLVLILAFALGPLLRSEEEIEPLHRPRPGTRNIRGPREEEIPEQPPPLPKEGAVRCRHCGAVADETFTYCGECLEPLDAR